MSKAFDNVVKLNKIYSVIDYGAKGDGVSDDTIALNAAAAAARANGAGLFIPPVTTFYKVSASLDFTDISVIDGRNAEIRGTYTDNAAVTIGAVATDVKEGYIWLAVRNTEDRSTTAGNRGIVLRSMSECKLWLYARGFNEGIYFDGASSNRVWVGNEFNIIKLFNNGSQVHLDLAGSSYAVANQFVGGGYYLGTNQKVDGRGTFKVTLGGSAICGQNIVKDAEIGIDGGSVHANHGCVLYAALNTSGNSNALFFQNTRLEAYGSWADPAKIVSCDTLTSGQINIDVEFVSISVPNENFVVSVEQLKTIDVSLRYIGGTSAGAFQNPIRLTPAPTFPYQMNNRIYVPGRVLYDAGTGYNVPVESIDTGVSARANRAIGDGKLIASTVDNAVGLLYSKQTTRPAFIRIPSGNLQIVVVCFDANGSVLSGTAPWYAQARQIRSQTRGSVTIYEARSNWLWLHRDVARFYLGQAAWSGPEQLQNNLAFEVTMGATIAEDSGLEATSPEYITDIPGGSYFRRGFQVGGRLSINGFRCNFLLETTASSGASSGATAIDAASVSGADGGDLIGIELDTVIVDTERQYFHTSITSIVGSTINLAAALPANVAAGRKIKINKWVSLESQNDTATATEIADATAAVNTSLFKKAGTLVYDTTNNRIMRAGVRGPTGVWWVVDGSASVTPS